jgi:charged multivesicular body protein 6
MHGLSMGNEVLKQLHQEMSLEKVEKLMDQTKEGVEYQRVSRAITFDEIVKLIE